MKFKIVSLLIVSSFALAETVSLHTLGVKPDLQLNLDHHNKSISIVNYEKNYRSRFTLMSLNNEINQESCGSFAEDLEYTDNPHNNTLNLEQPVTVVGPMLDILPRHKSFKERVYNRLGISSDNRYTFDDHYVVTQLDIKFDWGKDSLSSITGIAEAEQDLKSSLDASNFLKYMWQINRKDIACDLKSGQLKISLNVKGNLNIVDMQYSHPVVHVENTLKSLQRLLSPNLEKNLTKVTKEQRMIFLAGISGLALDQTQIKLLNLEPKKFSQIFGLLVNSNANVQKKLDPIAFTSSFAQPVSRSIPSNFSVEMNFQEVKGK